MLSIMIPTILRAQRESGLTITPAHLEAVRAEAFAQATMCIELGLKSLLENGGPDAPGLQTAINLVQATAAGPIAAAAMTKMRSGASS